MTGKNGAKLVHDPNALNHGVLLNMGPRDERPETEGASVMLREYYMR